MLLGGFIRVGAINFPKGGAAALRNQQPETFCCSVDARFILQLTLASNAATVAIKFSIPSIKSAQPDGSTPDGSTQGRRLCVSYPDLRQCCLTTNA